MPKFLAQTINALFTAERNAGRVARKARYIAATEASDGSWCEFDGETFGHAMLLADNAVDKLGCRGASVWEVDPVTGACVHKHYSTFPVLSFC